MKTILKSTTLILAILLISVSIDAQKNTSVQKRPAQFTFFYLLGSNGVVSPQYSNSFSLNAIAGINGGVSGVEIGGVLNYNHNEVTGAQVGGVANINRSNSRGALIAGALNFTGDNSHGFLLSTINVAAAEFTGFQLGVINITKKLNGVQLGVINVVEDGEKGLPVGLINVVKNGHYELELSVSEKLTANMNFKMGVERLHTIFKIAYVVNQDDHLYSAGIGLGRLVTLKGRHMLSIDASASQLYNQTIWEEGISPNCQVGPVI